MRTYRVCHKVIDRRLQCDFALLYGWRSECNECRPQPGANRRPLGKFICRALVLQMTGHSLQQPAGWRVWKILPTLLCIWMFRVIICQIAIEYSMGQIIKPACVCQYICVSVCAHSRGCISCSIFTKIGTYVRTNQKWQWVRWGQHRTIPSPFCPQNPHFRPIVHENPCNIALICIHHIFVIVWDCVSVILRLLCSALKVTLHLTTLKIIDYFTLHYITLNVLGSLTFSRLWGNRGQGTRWWRRILDRK